mgnify:CR=1 FL=1
MRTLSFNTGRLYTAHGQRIRAACDGETIYFEDKDRMVDGILPRAVCDFTPRAIMRAYDMGAYVHWPNVRDCAEIEALKAAAAEEPEAGLDVALKI